MKNYRDMFLALFITLQDIGYPNNTKISNQKPILKVDMK